MAPGLLRRPRLVHKLVTKDHKCLLLHDFFGEYEVNNATEALDILAVGPCSGTAEILDPCLRSGYHE